MKNAQEFIAAAWALSGLARFFNRKKPAAILAPSRPAFIAARRRPGNHGAPAHIQTAIRAAALEKRRRRAAAPGCSSYARQNAAR